MITIRKLTCIALSALAVAACTNPFDDSASRQAGSGAELKLEWSLPAASRTIAPASMPTASTYMVTLKATGQTDVVKSGLTTSTWTAGNLARTAWTIQVVANDSGGRIIAQGSSNVNLTTTASQSATIALDYIASGSGTGQIHLSFAMIAPPQAVDSVSLSLVDPSGSGTTPTVTFSGGQWSYSSTAATAGMYRAFILVRAGAKSATKMESLWVFQNVDTAATITFSTADFNTTYVPMTGVSLNKSSTALFIGGTETLGATLAPSDASNTLVSWSSDNTSVATVNSATGFVTGIATGTATITVRTADGNKTAACSVAVTAKPVMVVIPAGTFNNGVSDVTLSSFKMGKYEITQSQYQAVMGYNPSNFIGNADAADCPVEMVNWFDAAEFCNKLSAIDGLASVYSFGSRLPATGYPITSATVTVDLTKNGYRLPTEAQWEYAYRAGTTSTYYWGESTDGTAYAWYDANSGAQTHKVGQKISNAFGLYDIAGNVWEWCWDWYGDFPGGAQTDPLGVSSGTYRVKHGGGWSLGSGDLRPTYRYYFSPGDQNNNIVGFRVAAAVETLAVTGVGLNSYSLTLPVGGGTSTLTATVLPGTLVNTGVMWTSSAPAVASVSAAGVVTPLTVGTANIKATSAADASKSATCVVTVNPVPVTGVSVLPTTLSLAKDGGKGQLTATVSPPNATDKSITWSSNNVAVATVDSNGLVTSLAAGNASITARSVPYAAVSGECYVTVTNSIMDLVGVTGGSFSMGSVTYGPVHSVTLSSFRIGKYEVTQQQYLAVMGENPSVRAGETLPSGGAYPVMRVTWANAAAFCNALSAAEGLQSVYSFYTSGGVLNVTADWTKNGYRLPTEAEWEFAARGGNSTLGYTYSGSNTLNAVAWSYLDDDSYHLVGGKIANELGIYDMSGNVWEYCWDLRTDTYDTAVVQDPTGTLSTTTSDYSRALRGGCYSGGNDAIHGVRFRVTPSSGFTPWGADTWYGVGGFRVARNGL